MALGAWCSSPAAACAVLAVLHFGTSARLKRGSASQTANHSQVKQLGGGGGCCPEWAQDSDKCGTCYYYQKGWCGESAGNCDACGSLWCFGESETCGAYGCNSYAAGRPCQCDTNCKANGNCCSDYYAQCTNSDANSYWQRVDIKNSAALRERMRSGHERISYKRLWDAYKTVWVSLPGKCQGKIYDVYSTKCWRAGDEQCGVGGYKKEGDCYNREHSWPKSWWDRRVNDAYSDLFHVVPSDGYVNGKRGSLPYGVVDRPEYTSGEGDKMGRCSSSGFSGSCFEPADDNKGSLARGNLYMSVRYAGEFSCCENNAVSEATIKPWMLKVLLQWHKEFPPEEWEKEFNDRAQRAQGSRNPFIDFPHLAEVIFGGE